MNEEDQATFDYVPDESTSASAKSGGSFSWEASEYIDHNQGFNWFLGLVVSTLLLAIVVYLMTREIFAVVIVVIVGIIVGISARNKPRQLSYQLDPYNLTIGAKKYPLNSFRSYTIIEEGPVSSIELIPLRKLAPPISVFFETAAQEKIIKVLGNSLPYEERNMEAVERLSRRLHF